MSQLFVITKKTVFMQRVGDLVRTGHTLYVTGEVPMDRAADLHEKFCRLYDAGLNKLQSSRRRKLGFLSSRLLVLHQEGARNLVWVLLRTHGNPPVSGTDNLEKWRDAIKDRIIITGYELVRLTKPTEPKPVWTWRYTKEREQELREALVGYIRRRQDRELEQLIHIIWRSPGFAGVRAQVKKFGQLIKSEWRRSSKDCGMPDIPERIGYVQRLPDKGMLLPDLLRKNANNQEVNEH